MAETRNLESAARKTGIVTPHAPTWYQRLAAWIVFLFLRALALSLRKRFEDRSGLGARTASGRVIFCLWHNRLAMSMEAYRLICRVRRCEPRMVALVSASRDGGLLAAILERFGLRVARGSSSRRGSQALLELITWAEHDHDLAITPDGPRGPRYSVQQGVLSLAQLTGLPIVPVSFRAQRKIQAKSWDLFQIPLPFTRCDILFAEPLVVPRDATEEQRTELRQKLERKLLEMGGD